VANTVYLLLVILSLSFAACKGQEAQKPAEPPRLAEAQKPAISSEDKESLPIIVAFGDSLTAGYGLAPEEKYPHLLQKKLDTKGYHYRVVNAGVSGDTSAGGLKRFESSLQGDVRVVILQLGANDIYRNLSMGEMKNNLSEIIKRAKARRAKVLLAGVEAPAQLDDSLRKEIHDLFYSLARSHEVIFLPSILDRVAGIDSLNQADGIHPNAEGTKIVAERVYDHLRPLLSKDPAQLPDKAKARSR
jgi:acyl-CoA thioesterase I